MTVIPKQTLELEIPLHGNAYRFLLPVGVSLGDAYNAAIICANEIVKMMSEDVSKAGIMESDLHPARIQNSDSAEKELDELLEKQLQNNETFNILGEQDGV